MIDIRLRTRISDEELNEKVGKIVTDEDYNLLITRAARLRRPDGSLLGIYLPGVLSESFDRSYDVLTRIRGRTDNRGLASGGVRVKAGTTRTRSKPIMSSILGAMDPVGPNAYCRLTAFTAKEGEKWDDLRPLFQEVGKHFRDNVPDRYAVQMRHANETPPDWVIPGTPFTTITVNNTYPTGVHTDRGDLDEGFSCLAACRRGPYEGGVLTWPRYRVGVDMRHGDLCLMDAHEWHGNTRIVCACGTSPDGSCKKCGAERITIVAYYRTNMKTCGSLSVEDEKRRELAEKKNTRNLTDDEAEAEFVDQVTTTAT